MFARRIVGYDRQGSALREELPYGFAVVGSVGRAQGGGRQWREQSNGDASVSALSWRDFEGYRATSPIDDGVYFRRAAAARAPDGLILVPPFPPAAER